MTISNEATQAAHAAICEENFDDCLEWRGKCVKAVEAAAPIIRVEAAAEALREAADLIEPFSGIGLANGATRADVAAWLRARAVAERGGE